MTKIRLKWQVIVGCMIFLPHSSQAQDAGEGKQLVRAQVSGEARVRVESWYNFGFIGDADDSFTLFRAMLGADLTFGRRLRAYLQARTSLTTDRALPGGTREFHADDIAIHQAFVDLLFPSATMPY